MKKFAARGVVAISESVDCKKMSSNAVWTAPAICPRPVILPPEMDETKNGVSKDRDKERYTDDEGPANRTAIRLGDVISASPNEQS